MSDAETRPQPAHPRRRSRSWRARMLLIALVTAAAVGLGGYSLAAIQGRADEEEERADEAVSAVEQLCAQVESMGGFCAIDPEDLRGERGPEGPPGPPPTDEQVAAAVADYLSRVPPEPGRAPTLAEISAAVANYLERVPPEQGERGPGPTQEQILAAVTNYLISSPPPAGEQGPQGLPGEDGQDGQDGADGSPGPAGPTGPPGADGEDGADGQPPVSWTFTHDPIVGPPVTYRCSRVEDFSPEEPEYDCEPVDG